MLVFGRDDLLGRRLEGKEEKRDQINEIEAGKFEKWLTVPIAGPEVSASRSESQMISKLNHRATEERKIRKKGRCQLSPFSF